MIHNIQVGVNVDDASIIRGIEQAAIGEIQKGLFGDIVRTNWGRYEFSREFKNSFFYNYIDKVFEDERLRTTIAKETALVLADKLMHSNKFKEKIAGIISEGFQEFIENRSDGVSE